LEIRDRSGAQNLVADHLSRIEHVSNEDSPIRDDFPDDHLYILYSISDSFSTPWFANIVNYLVASIFPHFGPASAATLVVATTAVLSSINLLILNMASNMEVIWSFMASMLAFICSCTSPISLMILVLAHVR